VVGLRQYTTRCVHLDFSALALLHNCISAVFGIMGSMSQCHTKEWREAVSWTGNQLISVSVKHSLSLLVQAKESGMLRGRSHMQAVPQHDIASGDRVVQAICGSCQCSSRERSSTPLENFHLPTCGCLVRHDIMSCLESVFALIADIRLGRPALSPLIMPATQSSQPAACAGSSNHGVMYISVHQP
jgi:hypothetical protein